MYLGFYLEKKNGKDRSKNLFSFCCISANVSSVSLAPFYCNLPFIKLKLKSPVAYLRKLRDRERKSGMASGRGCLCGW